MVFPEEFCQRMNALLGNDAPAFFSALEKEPSRAFRFHENKVSEDRLKREFASFLGERIPFVKNAFRFQGEGIGNHPLHHGGALYVQEPAAMAPVAALGDIGPLRILDLCAAPGGKSLQACRLLPPDGVIVCNEPDDRRRKVLMQNLERMGEEKCQVTSYDARSLPREWEGSFDLVICDAPCSGEGMMRKNEDAVRLWSRENILLCARRQEEILEEAVFALAPGGTLLYSTCTWAPEENEERVAFLLERHPECTLIPPTPEVIAASAPGISLSDRTHNFSLTRRFYPHLFDGEGQYLAVIRKEGERSELQKKKKEKNKVKKSSENEKIAKAFLSEALTRIPSQAELFFRGNDCYLVPKNGISPDTTVSPGVLVGSVQKGRMIPHHRFFLSFANLFSGRHILTEGDGRVEAYLRGEEISLEGAEGWGVLFSEDCPLGGVKVSGGRGKNWYPKGLRKA